MLVEPAHAPLTDAPRVGDHDAALARVAPLNRHPGVVLIGTIGAPRIQPLTQRRAHTLQRMRAVGVQVRRHEVGPIADLEPIALALAAVLAAEEGRSASSTGERAGPQAADQPAAPARSLGFAWLDSGRDATAGRSVLAAGERVTLERGAALPRLRQALAGLGPHADQPADSFPLGLIGWFGYELRAETMGMHAPHVPDAHLASWLRIDRALVLDHATGTAHLTGLLDEDAFATWRDEMLALIAGAPATVAEPGEPAPCTPRWRDSDDHYADLVRRCQAAIRDGEAYQLCLTSAAEVDAPGDPLELYRRVRRSSPAHHGAYLKIGDTALLSASPETFLHVADGVVTTRPIKGTRRRDPDPARDAALAVELAASDKEQAENLMIVDLMRNDLQRVCEVGTVAVTALQAVESYPHVHQLVSTIEGRLREGLDALDAVAACLPAGSMTGAPKRRAIELLAEWEAAPRGIYSGAFGMLGIDGSADLAMVIRSIVVEAGRASVGAGGGITALSIPAEEVAEMHVKAAALLAALGSAASR